MEDTFIKALLGFIFIMMFVFLGFNIKANMGFCDRFFNDVPKWECVISERYRFY